MVLESSNNSSTKTSTYGFNDFGSCDPLLNNACSSKADYSSAEVPNEENCFKSHLYNSGAAVLPLFPGSGHSILQSLVKYFNWFCEHPGISKEELSSMLAMNPAMLPYGNNLPNSYETALRIIQPYLVQSIIYDVCPNDCIIFRKEYESLSVCPRCGGRRYVSNQSDIPTRRFTYLPLKPRFIRLFGNSNMAQVLQSHATIKNSDTNSVFDLHESWGWKSAYSIMECSKVILEAYL